MKPILWCVSLIVVAAGCTLPPPPAQPPPKPHRWRVYLESDITSTGTEVKAGTSSSSPSDVCGQAKFNTIWTRADELVDLANRSNGQIDLVAMFDNEARTLASADFNLTANHPRVRKLLSEQPGITAARLTEAISDIRRSESETAKQVGRKNHIDELLQTPQHTQNLILAIEDMRANVDTALRDSSGVTVVFVSDMLHYNTSKQSEGIPEAGQFNMLRDADRGYILSHQQMDNSWWLRGHALEPLVATRSSDISIWTSKVDRCTSGENLPGGERANWPMIEPDVRRFWTKAFITMGVAENSILWNYKPR